MFICQHEVAPTPVGSKPDDQNSKDDQDKRKFYDKCNF